MSNFSEIFCSVIGCEQTWFLGRAWVYCVTNMRGGGVFCRCAALENLQGLLRGYISKGINNLNLFLGSCCIAVRSSSSPNSLSKSGNFGLIYGRSPLFENSIVGGDRFPLGQEVGLPPERLLWPSGRSGPPVPSGIPPPTENPSWVIFSNRCGFKRSNDLIRIKFRSYTFAHRFAISSIGFI